MNAPARIACLGVASALVAAASGCLVPIAVGAGMGVAGYEYNQGELEYSVYAGVDKSWKAATAVIKERGWEIKEQTKDATGAFLRCIAQDGTQIKVDISRRTADFTRVAVRYGVWGDEGESKKFIEQVKARL